MLRAKWSRNVSTMGVQLKAVQGRMDAAAAVGVRSVAYEVRDQIQANIGFDPANETGQLKASWSVRRVSRSGIGASSFSVYSTAVYAHRVEVGYGPNAILSGDRVGPQGHHTLPHPYIVPALESVLGAGLTDQVTSTMAQEFKG